MDPEFYERFSKKISEILEEMRIGKLADIEALKQLRLIRDDVVDKKDETLPEKISSHKGADIFYRNLQESFGKHIYDEKVYIDIVLDILDIIKDEAIVDWYKNSDVKRKIMNAIDDYLYDVVKGQKNINLSDDEMKTIISTAMQLAENNNEVIA